MDHHRLRPLPPLLKLFPLRPLLLGALWSAALMGAAPALAQAPRPEGAEGQPAAYADALFLLESGDTTAAIARLRAATRSHRDFGPAWLRLGALLSEGAGEVEREHDERREARAALERAVRLLPDDPLALLELGILLRKQQVRVDARRVLERAWAAAERTGSELSSRDAARFHFTLARIYESWWEDWQNLVTIPETARGWWGCQNAHTFEGSIAQAFGDFAVACPRSWHEAAGQVVELEGLKDQDYARMLTHLRRAHEADPSHVLAAVHLLGHLADAREWDEYLSVAGTVVAEAPEDARSHLFLGLGLHERGSYEGAAVAFERALNRLAGAERTPFESVEPLLRREVAERYAALPAGSRARATETFFAATDPLYLTSANERRLEHFARVAWAELKYGAPASGLRGWETERGLIFIRYGAPERWYQCCFGDMRGPARRVYWSYGPEGPNFVFERQLTYRRARLSEPARMLADELAALAPEAYRPRTITAVHPFPHQLVRFRGESPELGRLELYSAVSLDSLEAAAGDRVDAGFFLLGEDHRPLWQNRQQPEAGASMLGLSYRLELAAGSYHYSLEARRAAHDSLPRPVARSREPLSIEPFGAGRLGLSDLLLADRIAERQPAPERRAQLDIAPSRTLAFEPDRPVHLYFEVYDLALDDDGLATYLAELTVQGEAGANVLRRLLRGGAELFGIGAGRDADSQRVTWERTVRPVDGVAIDYLRVEMPGAEPGDYTIRLTLTDPATGARRTAERTLRVGGVE